MCKFLVAEKRGTVNFNFNLLRNGVLSTLLCTATPRPAAFYVPNLLMTVLTAQHNHGANYEGSYLKGAERWNREREEKSLVGVLPVWPRVEAMPSFPVAIKVSRDAISCKVSISTLVS